MVAPEKKKWNLINEAGSHSLHVNILHLESTVESRCHDYHLTPSVNKKKLR